LVPISQIAEIADKLIRNEVVSRNEMRGFIGLKPSKDKTADQLSNPNMPTKDKTIPGEVVVPQDPATPKAINGTVPLTNPTAKAVVTPLKGVSQNGS
jgi:hypothetical protein